MHHSDINTTGTAATPGTRDWSGVEFTTYCPDGSNNCVQYAKLDDGVALRTTQNPNNVALLTNSEWGDLLHGVRTGAIS